MDYNKEVSFITIAAKHMNAELGFCPGNLEMNTINQLFSPTEALRIVYIPIILSEVAIEYARFVLKLCAEKRLPYKKQTRIIKDGIESYEKHISMSRKAIHQRLEQKVDEFIDLSGTDVDKLWYVIKNKLMERYPGLEDYSLPANIYSCVSLLNYAVQYDMEANFTIQKRLNIPRHIRMDADCSRIRDACLDIAKNYRIDCSDIIALAVKIIARRVEEFATVLHTDDNTTGDPVEK